MGKGVSERMLDAKLFLNVARHESALLSLLIAVAAASARAFPPGTKSIRNPTKKMGDRERFETYLNPTRLGAPMGITIAPGASVQNLAVVQVGGRPTPLRTVLYKHYRCSLVHEAELDELVRLELTPGPGLMLSCRDDGTFVLGTGIVDVLFGVLENDGYQAASP